MKVLLSAARGAPVVCSSGPMCDVKLLLVVMRAGTDPEHAINDDLR